MRVVKVTPWSGVTLTTSQVPLIIGKITNNVVPKHKNDLVQPSSQRNVLTKQLSRTNNERCEENTTY